MVRRRDARASAPSVSSLMTPVRCIDRAIATVRKWLHARPSQRMDRRRGRRRGEPSPNAKRTSQPAYSSAAAVSRLAGDRSPTAWSRSRLPPDHGRCPNISAAVYNLTGRTLARCRVPAAGAGGGRPVAAGCRHRQLLTDPARGIGHDPCTGHSQLLRSGPLAGSNQRISADAALE